MKKRVKRIDHRIKFWKDLLKADKTKRLKLTEQKIAIKLLNLTYFYY